MSSVTIRKGGGCFPPGQNAAPLFTGVLAVGVGFAIDVRKVGEAEEADREAAGDGRTPPEFQVVDVLVDKLDAPATEEDGPSV